MALLAIIAEIILVWIIMAVAATLESYASETLKILPASGFFFVALDALRSLVFANEHKISLVVVE